MAARSLRTAFVAGALSLSLIATSCGDSKEKESAPTTAPGAVLTGR